MTERSLEMQ